MATDDPKGVELRLVGDDPADVEAAARWLMREHGARVVVTGRAPARGGGLRIYATAYPPTTAADKTAW